MSSSVGFLIPLSAKTFMMLLTKPAGRQCAAFIEAEKNKPFSYAETGRTANPEPVAGYDNDFSDIILGKGEAVWEAAKSAVQNWKMFPGGWTFIHPGETPLREGEVVALAARVLGLWWLNSCRIVYVIDNGRQFGFAYGTLPGHVEKGEELFLVERAENGVIRYSIRAFSRPRHWLARLCYPLPRVWQRKFVRDSKRSMAGFVRNANLP